MRHPCPDARGVFLRCANYGRNNTIGNPGGDLAVGTYQNDEFQNHNHDLFIPGECRKFFISGPRSACELKGGLQTTNGFHAFFGDHGHSGVNRLELPKITSHKGGGETRPRCVIVNAYIKINRTTVENTQNHILIENLEKLPTKILQNERLRKVIRDMVREETEIFNANTAKHRAGNAR